MYNVLICSTVCKKQHMQHQKHNKVLRKLTKTNNNKVKIWKIKVLCFLCILKLFYECFKVPVLIIINSGYLENSLLYECKYVNRFRGITSVKHNHCFYECIYGLQKWGEAICNVTYFDFKPPFRCPYTMYGCEVVLSRSFLMKVFTLASDELLNPVL